ncbi:MAG: cell wall-binding repeat-containing protein, partial [Tissierellia bacterium]|nr:cell wall-binding repeat-containing protein [Tissierellia bacterium]
MKRRIFALIIAISLVFMNIMALASETIQDEKKDVEIVTEEKDKNENNAISEDEKRENDKEEEKETVDTNKDEENPENEEKEDDSQFVANRYTVRRTAGENRYETALKAANHIMDAKTAILASGENFAD